jgi:uncharacterized protein HemX
MFCTSCGKSLDPETRFCPSCGTPQFSQPRSAPQAGAAAPRSAPITASPDADAGKGSKAAVWAGVAALVLALAGGAGYWGWSSKVAGEGAAGKQAAEGQAGKAAAETAKSRVAESEQRRVSAEQSAETAEIAAAQALLDKHIAAEEAQALADGKRQTAAPAKTKTAAGTQ